MDLSSFPLRAEPVMSWVAVCPEHWRAAIAMP